MSKSIGADPIATTFSYAKITRDFGYDHRPISDTIRDTVNYLYDLGAQE